MKQSNPQTDIGLKVGDRVKLIAKTLAWKAEMTLQDKIGEVIERRDDGRVSILYDNGKLLMGRAAEPFELVSSLALQLSFCFEVRTLSARLVSSAP